jgi:type I restriction enzyme, S subunit
MSLIRSMNVQDNWFEWDDLARINATQAAALDNVSVELDDVLLNITGASVARCCSVPAATLPARVNQHVAILRADPAKAIGKFIEYTLTSPYGKSRLLGIAQGGATREALTKAALERFAIPLPPLIEQRKIAALLAAYDELIENNHRRIKLLEEMAQRIYREWFVDFRYPGRESVPLVDSDLGPIPKGWMVAPLSELVTTQYGYTESATSEPVGPRFLRGMDINKASYVDWSTVPYCPIDSIDHDKYRLLKDDILVIRMADPGKVGIVEVDVDAIFASYLIRIRPIEGRILPYVLFHFMLADGYQSFVRGASTGTTRKSLSAPLITAVHLPVAPLQIQMAFAAHVKPLRSFLNLLVSTNASLRTTRDHLLPRLISGEIDVTDLDIAMPDLAA